MTLTIHHRAELWDSTDVDCPTPPFDPNVITFTPTDGDDLENIAGWGTVDGPHVWLWRDQQVFGGIIAPNRRAYTEYGDGTCNQATGPSCEAEFIDVAASSTPAIFYESNASPNGKPGLYFTRRNTLRTIFLRDDIGLADPGPAYTDAFPDAGWTSVIVYKNAAASPSDFRELYNNGSNGRAVFAYLRSNGDLRLATSVSAYAQISRCNAPGDILIIAVWWDGTQYYIQERCGESIGSFTPASYAAGIHSGAFHYLDSSTAGTGNEYLYEGRHYDGVLSASDRQTLFSSLATYYGLSPCTPCPGSMTPFVTLIGAT